MRVVSHTSAFALEEQYLGARRIGELLGAASLVEGSVRRDGDRLRISVRLVDARDGYQRWSETYDRRVHDAIEIQEEIAQSVANTLAGASLEQQHALASDDIDPLAYDHYLKGRFYWHRRTEQGLRAAADHFAIAVQWLQRAFDQRSHSLVFLRVDPQLVVHRHEPALQRMAKRVSR